MLAGIVLAAGGGHRYGRPKALVRLDGTFLVSRAVDTLRSAGCRPVIVVLGAAADAVRERADLAGAVPAVNPDWSTGMGSSLRVGLAAAATGPADAAVVLLVDTPGIGPAAVRRVAAGAGRRTLAVASYADGRTGHPVVLGRTHWRAVAASATGDTGARDYLRAHPEQLRRVPCGDVADPTDVDRPADLARFADPDRSGAGDGPGDGSTRTVVAG